MPRLRPVSPPFLPSFLLCQSTLSARLPITLALQCMIPQCIAPRYIVSLPIGHSMSHPSVYDPRPQLMHRPIPHTQFGIRKPRIRNPRGPVHGAVSSWPIIPLGLNGAAEWSGFSPFDSSASHPAFANLCGSTPPTHWRPLPALALGIHIHPSDPILRNQWRVIEKPQPQRGGRQSPRKRCGVSGF